MSRENYFPILFTGKCVAQTYDIQNNTSKRREILIFPRTAGNTGNSRELLVIPGNYWEISYSLTQKLLIYLLKAIQLYLQCKNNHNSTFYQIIK